MLYLVFGGVSFLVSVSSFLIFIRVCGINELSANIISWFLAVTVAYITNRKWVFYSEASVGMPLVKQIVSFFAGRIMTLIIEEGLLLIFITVLSMDEVLVKVASQIVVIILNYFISKIFVFKKDG